MVLVQTRQRSLFTVLPIDPLYLMGLEICINSLSERGEERVLAESCEDAESLQLILYRVFHFGETEFNTTVVEPIIEFTECVGGSDIDARHRFRCHYDPRRGCRCVGDSFQHTFAEQFCVGKEEWSVPTKQDKAWNQACIWISR